MTTKQKWVIINKRKLNRANRERNKVRGYTDHDTKKKDGIIKE